MSPRTFIKGLCVALITIALSVLPADARKKDRQTVGQGTDAPYASARQPAAPRQVYCDGVPSFDGRCTGRPRTCGYDTFQYDGPFGSGTTIGPYCH